MSGHSKWATIKHQKETQDKKRGQIFSKLTRAIAIAAKEGADQNKNAKLRMEIEKARKFNLPKENIERAIQRAGGSGGEAALESVLYEAYGPGGVAILIEGITDNKNRTVGEIKHILGIHGAKLAGEGSVNWLFSRAVTIPVILPLASDKDAVSLEAIAAGAQDILETAEGLKATVLPEQLEGFKARLQALGATFGEARFEWVAKTPVNILPDAHQELERLFEALDAHDDVQEIYANLKE